ncbi:MAG: SDR family oxidoreductase [Bacteroidales bacterium]|nr:SDR family oxidoreductase [Bacteroidales bacterium]
MKKVLITGSNGFIGKNLLINLKYIEDIDVLTFDIEDDRNLLKDSLSQVDFVFHLAGINRPTRIEEFKEGNAELTQILVDTLIDLKKFVPIVFSSTTQAILDNPYGISKLEAESHILRYREKGGLGYIYRLTNVFGKWCKPNYNSVVATFCHNIAHGIDITISDRNKELELIHVDDVIEEFLDILFDRNPYSSNKILYVTPIYKITLGELADLIYSFNRIPETGIIPNMNNDFEKKLHSTYLSYILPEKASYSLVKFTDDRGFLFELIKSNSLGQIFISKTKPGITRGNHFHHLKNEKFCVIEGEAVIKFRHIVTNETAEFKVCGEEPKVVDILPGYTHSITNVGETNLITFFWANEPFNKDKPDTYFEKV